MRNSLRRVGVLGASILAILVLSRPVAAHVDYVTEGDGDPVDAVRFAIDVLSEPLNAALFTVGTLVIVGGILTYLAVRPTVRDLDVLVRTLDEYDDLVPWMLRLSLGLPILGAGFAGYLFSPSVPFDPVTNPLLRIALIAVGFALLVGLATRIFATLGVALYLWTLTSRPEAILAMEYLPGFVAILVLGGGRPSADDILLSVASTDGTLYGRVDPVHHLKAWLDETTTPYVRYVPLVLRVGIGVTFVYLGLTQKLAAPGPALEVVDKYDLTAVVPVDPGVWVLGAGLVEMGVGVALVLGLFTRASAATAFLMLTLTLFGLPDDPVLAHVTLFGMTSALFTLGGGPYAIDRWIASDDERVPPFARRADADRSG